MIIAIFTTLMFKSVLSYFEIGSAILVGGAIGTIIALRIEMTALPQLVAATAPPCAQALYALH